MNFPAILSLPSRISIANSHDHIFHPHALLGACHSPDKKVESVFSPREAGQAFGTTLNNRVQVQQCYMLSKLVYRTQYSFHLALP